LDTEGLLVAAALLDRVSEAHPARKQRNFFTRAALAKPVDDSRATIDATCRL
jgi:hypothetical protein